MPRRQTTGLRWQELRSAVRARWDKLTDADIDGVRGNSERLLDVLQARYGYTRQTAELEVTAWRRTLRAAA